MRACVRACARARVRAVRFGARLRARPRARSPSLGGAPSVTPSDACARNLGGARDASRHFCEPCDPGNHGWRGGGTASSVPQHGATRRNAIFCTAQHDLLHGATRFVAAQTTTRGGRRARRRMRRDGNVRARRASRPRRRRRSTRRRRRRSSHRSAHQPRSPHARWRGRARRYAGARVVREPAPPGGPGGPGEARRGGDGRRGEGRRGEANEAIKRAKGASERRRHRARTKSTRCVGAMACAKEGRRAEEYVNGIDDERPSLLRGGDVPCDRGRCLLELQAQPCSVRTCWRWRACALRCGAGDAHRRRRLLSHA